MTTHREWKENIQQALADDVNELCSSLHKRMEEKGEETNAKKGVVISIRGRQRRGRRKTKETATRWFAVACWRCFS